MISALSKVSECQDFVLPKVIQKTEGFVEVDLLIEMLVDVNAFGCQSSLVGVLALPRLFSRAIDLLLGFSCPCRWCSLLWLVWFLLRVFFFFGQAFLQLLRCFLWCGQVALAWCLLLFLVFGCVSLIMPWLYLCLLLSLVESRSAF